jgi:Bacterial transcriptional activator domain
LRETAQSALIRAHLVEGNRTEALRQYETYRRLLWSEVRLPPSDALRTLVTDGLDRRPWLPRHRDGGLAWARCAPPPGETATIGDSQVADAFESPPTTGRGGLPPETAAVPYEPDQPHGAQSSIAAVLARHEHELMAIDGVEGVGIARDRIGDDAIVVYVRDPSVGRRVPAEVDGHAVEVSVTGIIDAF